MPVVSDMQSTPWLSSLQRTEPQSRHQRLHDEIVAFASYIVPTPAEQRTRDQVYSLVVRAILHGFSRGVVSLFGSSAQGLSLFDGDIDVVVFTWRGLHPHAMKNALFQLSAEMKKAGLTSTVEVRLHARMPIISFQVIPDFASLRFDIGFNNEDGLKVTSAINKYLDEMPALRPLALVLKRSLSARRLNSAADGGINSYALLCMIIHLLQFNPFSRLDVWIREPMHNGSLGYLLMDFLKYYGFVFPYDTHYISVSAGKTLPKIDAEWLPTDDSGRLCVQCLVNPEVDIAKSASRTRSIKATFANWFHRLEGYMTSTDYDGQSSYLQNLVKLTAPDLDWRHRVQELTDSGVLTSNAGKV